MKRSTSGVKVTGGQLDLEAWEMHYSGTPSVKY